MCAPTKQKFIEGIVRSSVEAFAEGFKGRHEGEVDNPNGTINMKIHNVFIEKLGPDIQYYSALVRSLDSSLGNMLEKMAINIAKGFYEVEDRVDGVIYQEQIRTIADLLEGYKDRKSGKKPTTEDYKQINKSKIGDSHHKVHISDYYLLDKDTNTHYLVELKIGGDLDNKKARSEKEAIFEQYAILSNNLPDDAKIECKFATAYNRFGEGNEWKQERVKQFFSKDELLIGSEFWNFICKDEEGFQIVIDAYEESSQIIRDALESIKKTYLD